MDYFYFFLLIVVMGLIGYVNDETQRRSKKKLSVGEWC